MWGILENAPDAMLVVDRQGLVVFANALCGQLFGKPVDAIIGRPLAELLPERSRGAHEGHLQRTFEKSERRAMGVGLTLSGLKADGTEFPAEVSISHMEGHAVAAVRDVSERLRASHRLATLGVLVAGVAHELNNPLAALLSNLEELELRKAELPEDLREPLSDAVACGERMKHIASDLRVFTRAESAPMGPVCLAHVVSASLRIAGAQVRGKVTLSQSLDPDVWVRANEGRLGQLVLNLVVNAVQAFPPGGDVAAQRVSVTVRQGSPSTVLLEVADNGPGIAPVVKEQLFSSFVTTKPAGQGTGLGLTICRRIATEHHGSIEVQSELGRGARFVVQLPALER